mgnify:FL=1
MTADPFAADRDRLAAVLARRLRDARVANPDALARELVVMICGHGWRPLEALRRPQRTTGRRRSPQEMPEVAAARERMAAAAAAAAFRAREVA